MNMVTEIVSVLLILSLTQCKDDCIRNDRCNLQPDPGPCRALFTKYYYDKEAKQCKSFTYGGCDGMVFRLYAAAGKHVRRAAVSVYNVYFLFQRTFKFIALYFWYPG